METHPGRLAVTVGVLTYRRPERLAELLPPLVAQARDAQRAEGIAGRPRRVRIVVVDNDAEGSARDVVDAAAAAARDGDPIEIRGVVEEAPGISAARNRMLDECAGEDVLVFIDDDEMPTEGWLVGMLATWERHDVAAVGGPVELTFSGPAAADEFIQGGEYFVLPRYRTGEDIEETGSGNLLLDIARLRAHGIRFDPAYGISGGEDTKLCRDIVAAGERIVWCDEAVVVEPVPAERTTHAYARRRAFHRGAGWARQRLESAAPGAARAALRAQYAARGGFKAARGAAQAGIARVRRDEGARGAGVKEALGGAGIAAAAFGVRLDSYARPRPLGGFDVRDRVRLPRAVTVGLPTFRREETLGELLAVLLPQTAALGRGEVPAGAVADAAAVRREVAVVVVDNSPEGSARAVVEAVSAGPDGHLVRYVHEPHPGLAAVRNAIVDAALPDGLLAGIDDDEVPTPTWLANLVAAAERTGATAVAGTVEFLLDDDAEEWVVRSGHFDAPRREPGQELGGAGTGNLLLDLYQLRIAGVRFDTSYTATGGEDTRLVRDILLAGGRVIAAPEARVTEAVPLDRGGTRAWVLQRAERFGESWARVRADVRPGEGARVPWLRRPRLVARGLGRGAKGALRLARAQVRGDDVASARAEYELAGARGLLRGAVGIHREEYRRPSA